MPERCVPLQYLYKNVEHGQIPPGVSPDQLLQCTAVLLRCAVLVLRSLDLFPIEVIREVVVSRVLGDLMHCCATPVERSRRKLSLHGPAESRMGPVQRTALVRGALGLETDQGVAELGPVCGRRGVIDECAETCRDSPFDEDLLVGVGRGGDEY